MSCYIINIWVKPLCSANTLHKNFLKCLSTYKRTYATQKDGSTAILKPIEKFSDFETQIFNFWESKNYFKPNKSETESFVMLLPPPNVTGTLHLGHALTCTIQDVIIRWKKMKGESVLWIPGIDHAGIATQVVVEKHLKESLNLTKRDLKNEEFLKRMWKWKDEKSDIIIKQLKKLGASLDWSKLIFTLDSGHSALVTNSFIQLYRDGLIHRKKSLVNWSCSLKSTISDIEIDWVQIDENANFSVPGYDKPVPLGFIYNFAYKICDEDGEVVVSTTRPETILGDVAVAIHPDHPEVSKLKEKYLWHPFRNEKIPIIVDDFVDPGFKTGAVKITPSHSLTDYEIGLKHDLKSIEVINEDGFIIKIGSDEKFHGLKRFDARWAVIEELKNLNLFRGSEPHSMKVPVCSRSGDIIEFISKKQWFLKCDSLFEKALNAVKNGELIIKPKSFEKVWYDWLETKQLNDWNLSRQLLWGHQVPMYECQYKDKTMWFPGSSLEEAKSEASRSFGVPGDEIQVTQDPDVLDTWFSSGLLPINAAINQERNPLISLMVTGHDILFFWVVRMLMLTWQLTGKLPFENVLLHSLVYDTEGKKMSKSLGNVILPDDIINGISRPDMENRLSNSLQEGYISKNDFAKALARQKAKFPEGIPECGTDALRFTLCANYNHSEQMRFDMVACVSNRHFSNKILQGMNYFLKMIEAYKEKRKEFDLADIKAEKKKLNSFDNFVLSKLANLVESVENNLNSYDFSLVVHDIRNFMVKDFCNFYLTSTKPILKGASRLEFRKIVSVFFHCQETSLRLLSPVMPFITEHLYQALPSLNGFHKCESVTVAKYPDPAEWREFRDKDLESRFEKITDLLSCLRNARSLLNFKSELPNVYVKCPDELVELLFGELEHVFSNMGRVKSLTRVESLDKANVFRQRVTEDITVFIEHKMSKETLQILFGPTISREDEIRKGLEELMNTTEAPSWKTVPQSQRLVHNRKITNLMQFLEKIENFKLALEKCKL